MKFLFFILLLSPFANANLDLAPPAFNSDGKKIVFVDIQKALYQIEYQANRKRALVKSTLDFVVREGGHPVIDLVEKPTRMHIEGLGSVSSKVHWSPDKKTKMRVLGVSLNPGSYRVVIENPLTKYIKFSILGRDVFSAMWFTDLRDRSYLEKYMPSNLEFDQYEMTYEVRIPGIRKAHRVYTNGEVEELGKNHFRIRFPSYFTASSPFYHLAPKGYFVEEHFTFSSISGRSIPVELYAASSSNLSGVQAATIKILNELEADYGAWPHPSLTIYRSGRGGMEYAGATITSMRALGHELTHSYFARGVMPANGNSGWMDEAIASWRDGNYPRRKTPRYGGSDMGRISVYHRQTDTRAYSMGAAFLSYMDGKLSQMGKSMKGFLRALFTDRVFENIKTEKFIEDLKAYSGHSFKAEFDEYIFGAKGNQTMAIGENPFHPERSEEELMELLD